MALNYEFDFRVALDDGRHFPLPGDERANYTRGDIVIVDGKAFELGDTVKEWLPRNLVCKVTFEGEEIDIEDIDPNLRYPQKRR